jgi:hypothetical protein
MSAHPLSISARRCLLDARTRRRSPTIMSYLMPATIESPPAGCSVSVQSAARLIEEAVVVVLDDVRPLEQRVAVAGPEHSLKTASNVPLPIAAGLRRRRLNTDAWCRRLFAGVGCCAYGERSGWHGGLCFVLHPVGA